MIEQILEKYGVKLKRSGESYRGCCPIHQGDNTTAFCINKKGLWYCFSNCGGGNLPELIARLENITKKEAEKRIREYGFPFEKDHAHKEPVGIIPKIKEFALKLEPYPEYLVERRIKYDTARYFGIGLNQSVFHERIVIPIHSKYGTLIGYAGRSYDNEEPRYLFKKGFRKSHAIYDFHRVKYSKTIVLVEGFFDVFRLHQSGLSGMALMGSSISKAQEKLILSLQGNLILMFDGDKVGRKCTEQAIKLFKNKIPLKVIWLNDGLQPDKLDERDLKNLVADAKKIGN